jgi:hypothetical protein
VSLTLPRSPVVGVDEFIVGLLEPFCVDNPTQKPIHSWRIDVMRGALAIGTMTDLALDTILDYFVEW